MFVIDNLVAIVPISHGSFAALADKDDLSRAGMGIIYSI